MFCICKRSQGYSSTNKIRTKTYFVSELSEQKHLERIVVIIIFGQYFTTNIYQSCNWNYNSGQKTKINKIMLQFTNVIQYLIIKIYIYTTTCLTGCNLNIQLG